MADLTGVARTCMHCQTNSGALAEVGGLVPRDSDDAADLIVRNARIHTGDRRLGVPDLTSTVLVLPAVTSVTTHRLPAADAAWVRPRP